MVNQREKLPAIKSHDLLSNVEVGSRDKLKTLNLNCQSDSGQQNCQGGQSLPETFTYLGLFNNVFL